METNRETLELTNRFRSSSYSTSALPPTGNGNERAAGFRECNSVENILKEDDGSARQFLEKYRQMGQGENENQSRNSSRIRERRYSMVMLPSQDYNHHTNQVHQPTVERQQRFSPSDNNVILSKTVRKEKRKQREKRENRSMERLDYDSSASGLPVSEGGYPHRGQYHHLTVKTPMHICGSNAPIPYMDEGMQHARAEPFRQDPFGSAASLNAEGTKLAVETFQLLSLLLDPDARRYQFIYYVSTWIAQNLI
jgi:hypothetical protein